MTSPVLFYLGLLLMCSVPLTISLGLVLLYFHLCYAYLFAMVRIFQEKPLFNIPRGDPRDDAERVRFPTSDGLMLTGCYLRASAENVRGGSPTRRGVILFGVEFGSDCWSCLPYCEHLLKAGFDIFAFEPRNQGTSDSLPDYDPLQWVTEYEIRDTEAALVYLKSRPDVDPNGIGLFGISKGAGAGLFVASRDPFIRCVVSDGVFATYTTLVPYMRHWFRIYNRYYVLQGLLPSWFYGIIGMAGLREVEKVRNCKFPHLESALRRLKNCPLLMIHGAEDAYIKPTMAQALFAQANPPKEFWLIEGAKHNQGPQVAGETYRQRVLAFFEQHLASQPHSQGTESIGEASEEAVGCRL